MALEAQVDNDIKDAMRAKDMPRLNTLRMLKSAMKNAAIEKGGAEGVLDDTEGSAIIEADQAAPGFRRGFRRASRTRRQRESRDRSPFHLPPAGPFPPRKWPPSSSCSPKTGTTSEEANGWAW